MQIIQIAILLKRYSASVGWNKDGSRYFPVSFVGFVLFVESFHLVINLLVVIEGELGLDLTLEIVLTPDHAGLIYHKHTKKSQKPWQDGQLEIETFSSPPDVRFLHKLQTDVAWPRLIVRLPESFYPTLSIPKILVLVFTIVRVFFIFHFVIDLN